MSDSFMVAARIPMTRDGFDHWLDVEIPAAADAIDDPGAMYTGWFWDGKSPEDDWDLDRDGRTPRSLFAEQIVKGHGAVVLRHRDDALEAYLFHFGFDRWSVHMALLALAAAGRNATGDAEALFWAETSGSLCPPEWDGRLACLAIGRTTARFRPRHDLTEVIEALRPAESAFFALIGRLHAEEQGDGSYPSARNPEFVDPAVLA
ncbi:hypothetical protein BTM25_38100 [Actinomadura rubteroloni]|uniref:Uncharacterized protein n=1 Tax=Actinomadura rubteroloni TaxID=1926885 RepID=A0A2P4UJE1_9ACTN|nr:hypothetical protein [Actinomadura rubteroloni]POM25167.1 hypothetical protein BTM25_38100 [Actinomadura rubteroloni]